jgi:hypothetical protein
MMGVVLPLLLGVHGLMHLLGFAKAFGLAELPQLTQPISRPWGVLWLSAAVLTLATAALVPLAPRWWWSLGAVALVVSQTAILSSWSDARFGTGAGVVDQLNTLDTPRRFFLMVDAKGAVVTRSETVTLFNDICVLAPGELVRPSIARVPVDAHTARARYTQGPNTIGATLFFDDAGELVDFASDDRNPSPDESTASPTRWTTPLRDYGPVGPARLARKAETRWQAASGPWTYGEFELQSIAYNPGR